MTKMKDANMSAMKLIAMLALAIAITVSVSPHPAQAAESINLPAAQRISPVGWTGKAPAGEDVWAAYDGSLFTGLDGTDTIEIAFSKPHVVGGIVAKVAIGTNVAKPSFGILEYKSNGAWTPFKITETVVSGLPVAVAGPFKDTKCTKGRVIRIARIRVASVKADAIRIGKCAAPCGLMELELYTVAPQWDVTGRSTVIYDPMLGSDVRAGVLRPALRLVDRSEAAVDPYLKKEGKIIRIGNGFLELVLEQGEKLRLLEMQNKVIGKTIWKAKPGISRELLEVVTGFDGIGGNLSLKPKAIRNKTVTGQDTYSVPVSGKRFHVEVDLEGAPLSATMTFETATAWNYVRFWLTLKNESKKDVLIDTLKKPFLAIHNGSGFVRSEFPSNRDIHPGVTVAPGKTWRTESAVAGITGGKRPNRRRRVSNRYGRWYREYMRTICPYRMHWVSFNTYCASARFTYDNENKMLKLFTLWSRCGIKHALSLDGQLGDCLGRAPSKTRQKMRKLIGTLRDKTGIGVASWDARYGNLYYTGLTPKHRSKHKQPVCGSEPIVGEMRRKLAESIKYLGIVGWALDFGYDDKRGKCTEKGHLHPYHPKGRYSFYWSTIGARQWIRTLHEIQPGGVEGHINWGGRFMPDLDLCHVYSDRGADFFAIWPAVSSPHSWAQAMQKYMYKARHSGIPNYRKYNYWVGGRGAGIPPHNTGGWRYSLLSCISSSPNLVFTGPSLAIPDAEIVFTRAWVDWAGANRHQLTTAEDIFDDRHGTDYWRWVVNPKNKANPFGCVAHVQGDRGWFFLVNPTFRAYTAKITLEVADRMTLRRMYPGGGEIRSFRRGDTVNLTIPGRRVWAYKIGPEAFVKSGREKEKKLVPVELDLERHIGGWKTSVEGKQVVFETQIAGNARLTKHGCRLRLLWDTTDASKTPPVPMATINGAKKVVKALGKEKRSFRVVLAPGELKVGTNKMRIFVPMKTSSVFQGAWLDLAPVDAR